KGGIDTTNTLPAPPPQIFSTLIGDEEIEAGTCANMRATYSGGTPPYTLQWLPQGLFPDTAQALTQACGIKQDTTVTFIVTDAKGLSDTSRFSIKLKQAAATPAADSVLQTQLPRYDLPSPDISSLIKQDRRPAWLRLWRDHHLAFKIFLSLLILVLIGLAILWIRRRRPLVARRDKVEKPPYRWTFDLDIPEILATNDRILSLAQQMRGREESDAHQLNLPDTVKATIRKAGRLQPIYRAQTRPTEYLILIDRRSAQNHQAQLFNLLYETFKAQEIYARRYYYNGDPRVCWNEEFPGGLSMAELKDRYPNHRLLIFGSGYAFLSQRKGTFTKWANLIDAWEVKALLSPIPVEAWGRRELALGKKFQMMPTGLTGLRQVIEVLEKDAPTPPSIWKELKPVDEQIIALKGDDLIASLQDHFDQEAIEWIAACALWPSIHWDLTLFLGRKVKETYTPEGETPQLALAEIIKVARLPWFIEGEIPVEAKRALLSHLPAQRQNTLRAEIYTVMEGSQPELDSIAYEDFRMHIVSSQLGRTDLSQEERRQYERELAQLLADDVEPDFSIIEYLDKPKSQLDFLIPANLRAWIYHKGKPFYGWKEWIWAGPLAAILLLALWLIPIETQTESLLRVDPQDQIIVDLADELARTFDSRGIADRQAQDRHRRLQVQPNDSAPILIQMLFDQMEESITPQMLKSGKLSSTNPILANPEFYNYFIGRLRSLDSTYLKAGQDILSQFMANPRNQIQVQDSLDLIRFVHFVQALYIKKHSFYLRNDSLLATRSDSLNFEPGRATTEYLVNGTAVLDQTIDFLKAYPGYQVHIISASDLAELDSLPNLRTNATTFLTKKRAESVEAYMRDQGIASDRITRAMVENSFEEKLPHIRLNVFYAQTLGSLQASRLFPSTQGGRTSFKLSQDSIRLSSRIVDSMRVLNAKLLYNEAARIYEREDTATARKFLLASLAFDSLPYAKNLLLRLENDLTCPGPLQTRIEILDHTTTIRTPISGVVVTLAGRLFLTRSNGQLDLSIDTCGLSDDLILDLKHPNYEDVKLTLKEAIEVNWSLRMTPKREEESNVGAAEGGDTTSQTYDAMNLTLRVVDADDRRKGVNAFIFGYREDEYVFSSTGVEGTYTQRFTTDILNAQDKIVAFHDPINYEGFEMEASKYFAPDGKFKAPRLSETYAVSRKIFFQIGVKDAETRANIDDSPDIRYAQGNEAPRGVYFELVDNGEYFYGDTTYSASKGSPTFEVSVPGYATQTIVVDTFQWGAYPDNQVRFDVYLREEEKVSPATGGYYLYAPPGLAAIQTFEGHRQSVLSVAFSPDGQYIFTGSTDQDAKLWDRQGNLLQTFKGHRSNIVGVAFSPDGQYVLTGSSDETAKLWDLKGREIMTFKGHTSNVYAVAFSPDGNYILTGSLDSTARLWDLRGRELGVFRGHKDAVRTVDFSPDGTTILTGSFDGTAKLWTREGRNIQTYKGHSDNVFSGVFS
ncbi:MAG: hypothetical protein AAFR59_01370, partial [Bacteroidota bacterium]